jgi:hypothetical protein
MAGGVVGPFALASLARPDSNRAILRNAKAAEESADRPKPIRPASR